MIWWMIDTNDLVHSTTHISIDFLLNFFFFSDRIMMYWCRLSRQNNLRFEILRCVNVTAKPYNDMILIWYLWLIGRRWKTIWIWFCCIMKFRFVFFFLPHYFEDTRVDKMIALRTDPFLWTVLIHSYVMMSLNRMRRHIRPLMKRTMFFRYVRWD